MRGGCSLSPSEPPPPPRASVSLSAQLRPPTPALARGRGPVDAPREASAAILVKGGAFAPPPRPRGTGRPSLARAGASGGEEGARFRCRLRVRGKKKAQRLRTSPRSSLQSTWAPGCGQRRAGERCGEEASEDQRRRGAGGGGLGEFILEGVSCCAWPQRVLWSSFCGWRCSGSGENYAGGGWSTLRKALFRLTRPQSQRTSTKGIAMKRSTMKKKESGAEGRKSPKLEAEEAVAENRGVIDLALQSQIEKERQRWRDILKRILDGIKFFVTQNLALQGHGESLQLDDVCNAGNFLGLLKLLAVYDPVTEEHLRYMEAHPGATSYLSPGIQNEFIHLMASTVRQSLLRGIRKARYYGLMFDTTPDLAQESEQMSEVVRYVEVDFQKRTVRVRESFLGFIQISQKDAESLVQNILKQLEEDGMDLQDCRSQCYDNAAVMAGHRSGVDQRICEKNPLALVVNCDNHSLNLVGMHAARQDPVVGTLFATIESIYLFFSQSTQRWEKLQNTVPEVVKSQSETRWSARPEAVKPVATYVEEILQLLYNMAYVDNETSDTAGDARTVYKSMLDYQFLTLLGFWNRILISIDEVQKRLQDPKMNFHDAAQDLKALRDHFLDEREVLVSESLERGFGLCEEWDVEVERRVRSKKRMAGEKSRDAGLTAKQEMERVMKETLDRLHREMDERFARLHDTDTKFGFLLDTKGLCYSDEKANLKNNCETFAQFYSSDVDGEQLYEEIMDCRMLLSKRDNVRILRPEQLLQFIVQYGDESLFPNLRVAVQIMLTIAVSIASYERSFSKLELILSCLRDRMGEERLCDLALLSIEEEESEKTDFNDMVDQFASIKARKVSL